MLKIGETSSAYEQGNAMYAGGHTGLATLRRDGFASMQTDSPCGVLATRLVTFSGSHLFVNLDAPRGELRAEILSERGDVIQPFSLDNCRPLAADVTRTRLTWNGVQDLSSLAGRPVQFRFHLHDGHLYSFWVSESRSGASRGYLAAGGPGLPGPMDV